MNVPDRLGHAIPSGRRAEPDWVAPAPCRDGGQTSFGSLPRPGCMTILEPHPAHPALLPYISPQGRGTIGDDDDDDDDDDVQPLDANVEALPRGKAIHKRR